MGDSGPLKRKQMFEVTGTIDEHGNKRQKPQEEKDVWIQMEIPSACVGSVVGKQGAYIKWLCETSGCKIQVGKKDASNGDPNAERDVDFQGSAMQVFIGQVLVLRKVIETVNQEREKNGLFVDKCQRHTMEIALPQMWYESIIGRGRSEDTVYVEETSGIKITDSHGSFNPEGDRKIEMVGTMLEGHLASVVLDNLMEGRILPDHIARNEVQYGGGVDIRLGAGERRGSVNAGRDFKPAPSVSAASTQPSFGASPGGYDYPTQEPQMNYQTNAPLGAAQPTTGPAAERYSGLQMLFVADKVGQNLVGTRGRIIGEIQQGSGCDVQVEKNGYLQIKPKNDDDAKKPFFSKDFKKVEFVGTASEQVRAAEIVGEKSISALGEVIMCIPKKTTSVVVGSKGAGIKRIQELCNGVSVQVRETSHGMGAVILRSGDWKTALGMIFTTVDEHMNKVQMQQQQHQPHPDPY